MRTLIRSAHYTGKALRHMLRGHRVRAGYYMGFRTITRRCSCGEEWEVRR